MRATVVIAAMAGVFLVAALAFAFQQSGVLAIPESDRAVHAAVSIDGETTASVLVRDTSVLTVRAAAPFGRSSEIGDVLALSPSIPELSTGESPTISWYALVAKDGAIAPLDRSQGEPPVVPFAQTVDFAWNGHRVEVTPTTSTWKEMRFAFQPREDAGFGDVESFINRYGLVGDGTCCVSCRGWTICGAEVDSACGQCSVEFVAPDDSAPATAQAL